MERVEKKGVSKKWFAFGVALVVLAGTAEAQEKAQSSKGQSKAAAADVDNSRRPNFGGILGMLSTGQPDLETSLNFGITGEYRPTRTIGVGLSLSFYNDKNRVQDSFSEYSLVPILAEVSYHFGDPQDGGIAGLKVGTKQGFIIQSGTVTVAGVEVEDDSTNLAFGPFVGYDAFVSKNISFGGEFLVVRRFQDEGFTMTNIQGIVRFWI